MASIYNIPNQYNGDTFEQITFNFYNTSSDAGNEIDLNGATPKMDIRRGNSRGKVVKQLTIGDGLEWVNQSLGQFRTQAFLIDWGGGDYVYDLQITYSSTSVTTYIKGSFKVTEDITD